MFNETISLTSRELRSILEWMDEIWKGASGEMIFLFFLLFHGGNGLHYQDLTVSYERGWA